MCLMIMSICTRKSIENSSRTKPTLRCQWIISDNGWRNVNKIGQFQENWQGEYTRWMGSTWILWKSISSTFRNACDAVSATFECCIFWLNSDIYWKMDALWQIEKIGQMASSWRRAQRFSKTEMAPTEKYGNCLVVHHLRYPP